MTVFGVLVQDPSAVIGYPSPALTGLVCAVTALVIWRFVKLGETSRADQPAPVPETPEIDRRRRH